MIRSVSLFLVIIFSCSSEVPGSAITADSLLVENQTAIKKDQQKESMTAIDKSSILGAWTDGTTENASFNIEKSSIFYLDQLEAFPYQLQGNSLTIIYPDFTFVGTVELINDSLVISDPEFGVTRYGRYKK